MKKETIKGVIAVSIQSGILRQTEFVLKARLTCPKDLFELPLALSRCGFPSAEAFFDQQLRSAVEQYTKLAQGVVSQGLELQTKKPSILE